ncbi:MAG: acetate--CoA ligase family protein [Ottowia sp.]|uniref:acetate--CoA ligase family protein n=1 Tax=Ottowia sp. TaxID=1898956 RepID=UPI003C71C745
MTTSNLQAALQPRSIAIIGASQNPDKIGGRPVDYLQRFGYRGKVYPVNPGRPEVQGLRAWPSVDALPEAPDLAIIAVPRAEATEAVQQCARIGTRVSVVMSSGFGEGNSSEGAALERAMVADARAAGMRLVGPNCQGLANFSNGALATFSTMIKECPPADGHIAILSQSGTLGMAPYGLLRRRGLGVRHAHATGNDADVTIAELAAAVAEDEQVRLMLLYLEGMPDPHNLARLGWIAQERGLPVLALKSGRTAAGKAAAQSHTGALASEDRVVDAFFEQHGIWRAQTMEELVDGAEMYLKRWKVGGRSVVTVSNSGAAGVLAADAVTLHGMQMASFAPETRQALEGILPSFANVSNPVDITGALLTDSSLFTKALGVIAQDPAADAFLVAFPVAGAGYDVESYADAAAALEESTGKPVVAASPQPDVAALFRQREVPVFTSESRAVAMLDQLTRHHQRLEEARRRFAGTPLHTGGLLEADPTPASPRMVNEAESLAALADAGVPVVRHRLCARADEARAALETFGAPVVVKGCSSAVAHKSELGLVRLGLRTEEEVVAAFVEMQETTVARGLPFEGVIVAAMERGQRELMIGAHRDPVFGPVVVIGDGGKYVESMPDNQLLLLPCTRDEVISRMQRLRIAPLLVGVRGDPPLDTHAFVDAVLAVAHLMLNATDVQSVDLNPVIVSAAGQGCRAVDAVLLRA